MNIKENNSGLIAAASSNPIDLTSLRLSQNFTESAGVKKVLTTVPVRKPHKQEFVRVRAGEECRLETMLLEVKEDREIYIVAPDLWDDLSSELVPKVLYLTINRQGILSLWPVRMPTEDGRVDAWSNSANDAAAIAQDRWIKVSANMHLGAYEVFEATGTIADPVWPELPFSEILNIAFKQRYITSLDHPVIRSLKGAM